MKFNILRVISFVIIFFLGLTVWYLNEVTETTKKNNVLLVTEKKSLEKKLGDVFLQKKSLEADLSNLTKEKNALAAKVNDAEDRLQEITSAMDKIRLDMANKDDELSRKNSEVEALKKRIDDYETEIAEMNKRLSQVPGGALAGETEAASKRDEAVSLEPITVTTKGKKEEVRVLDVNKDYGFIVINIGSVHGIKKGDVLFVSRNKKLLGKVVLEKVSEEVSIGKILYRSLAETVRKGDQVTY